MKITDVRVTLLAAPPRPISGKAPYLVTPMSIFYEGRKPIRDASGGRMNLVLVEVLTDEGLTGLGTVGVGGGTAKHIIENHLKNFVVGENPFDVELLWERMYRSTINYGRKGIAVEAISAVDIALWDIMGKKAGQPIYNLLGGKTRDRIQVYASRLYAIEIDDLVREAEGYLKQGFRAMKQRFGYGPRDGTAGMKKNGELVKAVREVVGYDVDLMADAYMGWDLDYAIRMVRMLDEYQLRWVEEPLIPDDIDGYVKLSASVDTPISTGEHEFTRWGFRELISRRAASILQPDTNRVGGITEARKVYAMASGAGLPVIPHSGQMHNYHLIMSHMNCPIAEYFPPPEGEPDGNEMFWKIFIGEPVAKDGYVELPDKPGLGLTLNQDAVERYRVKER
jgi:L-alanine-DL-glutamate epimerase-like enolase superfamily enzyme